MNKISDSVTNTFNLRLQLQYGKFSWLLRNYYNGQEGKPDISILIREINDKYIPRCLDEPYKIEDIIDQYKDPSNLDFLFNAIDDMLITVKSYATSEINKPYFTSRNVVPLLLFDIYENLDFFKGLKKSSYEISIVENDTFFNDLPRALKAFPIEFKPFRYKKAEPKIMENFEIGFNPIMNIDELFSFITFFRKMGAKYVTPIKFKANSNISFTIGHKNKRLEEIYDRQPRFNKESLVCSIENLGQSYKTYNFKLFPEALPIDSFLELKNIKSINEILSHFNLLKYRIKPTVNKRDFQNDYDDGFSFELTDRDLRDMYRGAFDGDPNNEWNID